jgi:glycosyltransferase involved in cell wall biosynthesis
LSRVPAFALALRRSHADIFHAHLTWPLAAKNALLAAIAARAPAVLATVQLYMDVPVSRGMAVQERLIAAGADRLVAVSQHNACCLEDLVHWPRRKMDVIRNAVAPARYQVAPNPALREALSGDSPLVLSVARMSPQKGLQHLLAAAAEVPEAVFALAGDGPERASLERLAGWLGVSDRIRFLGQRADIAALLAVCDVFVLPSLYEGLPVSVLEAMAAARPVLATAIGGTDEAITDGVSGMLVPPAQPAALAAALRRLLSDAGLRDRLGAAGQARVISDFSTREMVGRIADLYELLAPQVAARRPR